MSKSKSSKNWLKEHFGDNYVKRSQQLGYRSRASFKLLEIDQKDHLLRPGMTVLDLGAAPGGWSQVASGKVGSAGRVIASDILAIDPIPGVDFLQGDFTEAEVPDRIRVLIGDSKVDLVLSDMAPNISGVKAIDQPQVMYLAELALELARTQLKEGGGLLVKVFHGEGLDVFQGELKSCFRSVRVRKPDASRARSSEIYLLATGFIATN
ncbi:MAG: 23S rRNA (uridine(2552)-2'-O)-methyltransferase RlmE [Pseudohongiellaceae bacterium]